jgi:platelet-activating factor acetylhydrolase IB subunit alpha
VSASRDRTLRVWDVTTGYCVKTIRGHGDWIRDVSPSYDGRWLVSGGNDQTARLWDASSGEEKGQFIGHDHVIECVAIAPPSSYEYLASLAGLKKPPAPSSSAEFIATGSRDKSIKLWDGRGTLIKTLVGHDNWIRALLFHPGGKYLLSCGDDKTIRCWDLTQEGKCVKVVDNAHEHFVTKMRWAPSVDKGPVVNGESSNGVQVNGVKREEKSNVQIRCVIATSCVDQHVRVFAS